MMRWRWAMVLSVVLSACGGGGSSGGGLAPPAAPDPDPPPPPAASSAEPTLWLSESDSATNPGTVATLGNGARTLFLRAESGTDRTATGVVCLDGDGHEFCALQLQITGDGGVRLDGFAPDAENDVLSRLNGDTLTLNWLAAQDGLSGVLRLGQLDVTVTGAGEVRVSAPSQAVGADLSVLTLRTNDADRSGLLAEGS